MSLSESDSATIDLLHTVLLDPTISLDGLLELECSFGSVELQLESMGESFLSHQYSVLESYSASLSNPSAQSCQFHTLQSSTSLQFLKF